MQTDLKFKLIPLVVALHLSACGGGDGGSNNDNSITGGDTNGGGSTTTSSYSLSGNISTVSGSVVDIDVNDPSRQNKTSSPATFQSNNTILDAQTLPNPAILNGFISATGTGTPASGTSNFSSTGDNDDYYSAFLTAGQFVSLQISDFNSDNPTQNDIDLELYDNNNQLVMSSINTNSAFESVPVPTQGNYTIRVRAINGVSKYVMTIGNTSLATGLSAYGQSVNIIPGEAVIQMQTAALSIQQTNSAPAIALSHTDISRPALTRFTIPDITIKSQALSKNAAILNEKNHAKLATLDYIKQLNTRADVEYAEPNYRVEANIIPNDPFYGFQAHYPQINLPQAWDITTGTPSTGSVIVAVVDTGVVLTHEDLAGQLINGYDFISDPTNSADGGGIDNNADDPGDGTNGNPSSWHGTHVAGTVAAASNNNMGVSGVSWGAKIMPIRVLGTTGGSSYDVAQGVLYAAGLANDSGTVPTQAADIINLSLGGSGFSQFAQNVYNQVRQAGVIVIASAGNENTNIPSYPASYDNVVSVSAVGLDNNLAPYSNFGTQVDVAAPGGNFASDINGDGYPDGVLSTLIDDSNGPRNPVYQFYQGTSMASPHVAGVAALMKAVYPTLTPGDFDSSLQNGLLSNDLGAAGRDNLYGAGLIDALKSVQQAQLLSGGEVTGSLSSTPSMVAFGAVISTRPLTLSQTGSQPPSVVDFTNSAPWLSVDDSAVAADGSGTYNLSVDRSGLGDATYSDNIVFTLDNGALLTVPVTLQVQNNAAISGDAGFLYVLLLNADTPDTVVSQTTADVVNGSYQYSFTNVAAGEYLILASSDIDNDLTICSPGESCGRYPTNDQPVRVVVTNQNVSGLNFLASVMANMVSTTQVSTNRLEIIDNLNQDSGDKTMYRNPTP